MRWTTANKQPTQQQSRQARRQRGAAMTELVVVLPALLLLGLGSIQSALFHQAKTTVTYATFEAARTGATTHALKAPMLDQFGLRMAPIFGGDGSGSDAVAAIAKGKTEARNATITRIDIINPTREAFQDFGILNPDTGQLEIPNSHLRHRDANDIRANSGVNIQDANLLKIKTTYGYQLKVPLINGIVTAALKKIDPQNAAFYDQNRIPISAVATVRMHSAAWEDGNLTVAGTPPGSGVVPNGNLGGGVTPGGQTGGDGDQSGSGIDGQGSESSSSGDDLNNNTGEEETNDSNEGDSFLDGTKPECESRWSDDAYNQDNTTVDVWLLGETEVPLSGVVKSTYQVVEDFVTGVVDGLVGQVTGLIDFVKTVLSDFDVVTEMFGKIKEDPKGFFVELGQALVSDARKLVECGPTDIGQVIGENLDPTRFVGALSKVLKIDGLLARYSDDIGDLKKNDSDGPDVPCSKLSASFMAGTVVFTPTGPVSIEQLAVGDSVLSRNAANFQDATRSVTHLHTRVAEGIYRIETDGGIIRVTGEHPLWVQGKSWTPAKAIQAYDAIATADGDVYVISTAYTPGDIRVFNLTVQGSPSYFAGEAQVWAHNVNGCPKKLRGNLGPPPFDDIAYQAHHKIPGSLDEDFAVLKDLTKDGYDINRRTNGIYLPSSSKGAWEHYVRTGEKLPVHLGKHGDNGYFKRIREDLKEIDATYGEAKQIQGQEAADAYAKKAIGDLETSIDKKLRDLNSPLNTSNKHRPWQNDDVTNKVDAIRADYQNGKLTDAEVSDALGDLFSESGGRVTNDTNVRPTG